MLRFSSDGDKVQVSVRPPLVYVVHYYESVRRPEPFLPYSVHVSTNALCLALPGIPNVRERGGERERERERGEITEETFTPATKPKGKIMQLVRARGWRRDETPAWRCRAVQSPYRNVDASTAWPPSVAIARVAFPYRHRRQRSRSAKKSHGGY
jgi:hypothetical protein